MSQTLHCPKCSRDDSLSVIERFTLQTPCDLITLEGPTYSPDGNDLEPSALELIGVICQCGWSYEGPDWISHLDS